MDDTGFIFWAAVKYYPEYMRESCGAPATEDISEEDMSSGGDKIEPKEDTVT